jgi:hypothetical protein
MAVDAGLPVGALLDVIEARVRVGAEAQLPGVLDLHGFLPVGLRVKVPPEK